MSMHIGHSYHLNQNLIFNLTPRELPLVEEYISPLIVAEPKSQTMLWPWGYEHQVILKYLKEFSYEGFPSNI